MVANPPESKLAQPTVADHWQAAMLAGIEDGTIQPVYGELCHTFTPGINGTQLYSRQITMPAGSMIVSEIHRTCHNYIVSKGVLAVHTPDGKVERITSPYQGITVPGTQRILAIFEETVWTTNHIIPDTLTDPEEIKAWLTIPINNPLLNQ